MKSITFAPKLLSSILPIERELASRHGEFTLFALVLREDSTDRWDLLVAAPWVQEDDDLALRVISDSLVKALKREELIQVSRIVTLDQTDPELKAFAQTIQTSHEPVEIVNSTLFGQPIKRAYVITSIAPEPQPKSGSRGKRRRIQ